MHFNSLAISNLRAIRHFELDDLGPFVVVAGPNGSGKSCVFDSMRLLKSLYGGSSANEYHQWFGEFSINLQDPQSVRKLFRDPGKTISVSADLRFAPSEVEFLKANASRLAQPLAWLRVTGQPVDPWGFNRLAFFDQLRTRRPELDAATQQLAEEIRSATTDGHQLQFLIQPDGAIETVPCVPVEAAFAAFEPRSLGIIEYHSASRTYHRQEIGGINLDTRAFENQQRQHRLYNWQNKYQNIRTELASSYLRRLVAEAAGSPSLETDLNTTLADLFATFFPDKRYLGVRPSAEGSLEFPVELSTGEVHDIDELSSGEKEILYGYLKLRNSTPRRSIILLDEPELHLNPSLLQGYTEFYYRHLGLEQDNQLWLVTHSDTLLRQAVGNMNFNVFQMVPATAPDCPSNQALPVEADDDVERATLQLVGDLAAYRPHGKVLILEGASDDGFDVNMVKRLFPQIARRLNIVSGGNKTRVRDLYEAMDAAAKSAGLKNRFFAIVDRDREPPAAASAGAATVFVWDVYHIENYLLHTTSIRAAVASLKGTDPFASDAEVEDRLEQCARELIPDLVLEELRAQTNAQIIREISLGTGGGKRTAYQDLSKAIQGSVARLTATAETLTPDRLKQDAELLKGRLEQSFADGRWKQEVPGRKVLRRFCHATLHGGVDGSLFINMVLDKMTELQVRPVGMSRVLDEIVSK